jgi:hypothetical protein
MEHYDDVLHTDSIHSPLADRAQNTDAGDLSDKVHATGPYGG